MTTIGFLVATNLIAILFALAYRSDYNQLRATYFRSRRD